jgi:hypothetical protein
MIPEVDQSSRVEESINQSINPSFPSFLCISCFFLAFVYSPLIIMYLLTIEQLKGTRRLCLIGRYSNTSSIVLYCNTIKIVILRVRTCIRYSLRFCFNLNKIKWIASSHDITSAICHDALDMIFSFLLILLIDRLFNFSSLVGVDHSIEY